MEKFPVDLLVYGLIILGFVVFNYLMQQAARRKQEASAQEQPSGDEELLAQEDYVWGRAPQAAPAAPVFAVPAAPTTAPPISFVPAPRRLAARSLFRYRGNLRDAIVVMTVLGPCRAEELRGR